MMPSNEFIYQWIKKKTPSQKWRIFPPLQDSVQPQWKVRGLAIVKLISLFIESRVFVLRCPYMLQHRVDFQPHISWNIGHKARRKHFRSVSAKACANNTSRAHCGWWWVESISKISYRERTCTILIIALLCN